MKHRGLRKIAWIMAAALVLSGCGTAAGTNGPADAVQGSAEAGESGGRKVILAGDAVEHNIRPQDDFYGYVNWETLWNLTVSYGENTAGGFQEVFLGIDAQLTELILEVVNSGETYAPGTDERIISDYYALCAAGRLTDKKIFDRIFSEIDAVSDVDDLLYVSGELFAKYAVPAIYSLEVRTDPYHPSGKILALGYLDTFMRNLQGMYEEDSELNEFRDVLENILLGLGAGYEEAGERADKIAYLWYDIATETDFEALNARDIEKLANRYTLSELTAFLPAADGKEFLENFGLTDAELCCVKEVVVCLPDQMEKARSLVTQENLEVWKDYLRCAVCGTYAGYLPAGYTLDEPQEGPMEQENILEKIKTDCYENLSTLYYEKYYTKELSDAMKRMEKDIRSAYADMIRGADWLTEESRKLFAEKFENIHFFFGGQERTECDPRRKNLTGDTILETILKKNELDTRLRYEELLKEADITKWKMGAQEVNAYFDPEANSIYITTGILHAPFFDAEADDATNLGGIGAVICHELSHAFDTTGILYDKNGAYNPEWILQADRDAFAKVVERVDAHYDAYALLDVYHVDGEKTVGENLADLGAMQCILSMVNSPEQRGNLFENYARIWCTLYQKDDLIFYLTQDEHSPDPVRVNAVLSCFDEFYELYEVKPGDGMYLAPERRVKRW